MKRKFEKTLQYFLQGPTHLQ